MSAIWQLILALPEVIRLIGELQRNIEKQEADRKIKNDVKAIREAFANQDAEKLNAVFNPKPNII